MTPNPVRDDRFDERHLTELLQTMGPRLQRVLASQKMSPNDAEDVLQELLLSLMQRWSEIECPERWLLAALRKACITFHRRQRAVAAKLSELSVDLATARSARGPRDRLGDLELALDRLPLRQRTLLRMRYLEELSPREVCAALSISPASFQRLRRRAVDQLRNLLVSRTSVDVASDQPARVALR